MERIRIKDLREDHDLLQKDVAAYLHCSQQVYSDYEKGKVELSLDSLMKLARLYNTTTDYILGLTDERQRPWSTWPKEK